MLKKNKDKIRAKRFREIWSCARPQGSITPNKKKFSRNRQKNIDKKEVINN